MCLRMEKLMMFIRSTASLVKQKFEMKVGVYAFFMDVFENEIIMTCLMC